MTYKTAYRLIEDELKKTELLYRGSLQTDNELINAIVSHGLQFGGKRLRAALVLLCGRIFNETLTENHRKIAAAIELIHTGTLIHDDILDGASVRRGIKTINTKWDSEISVLSGDFVFMRAMRLITETESLFAFKQISEAANLTCEGELRQIGTRDRFDTAESEYRKIIAGKTAALFSAACVLGTYLSNPKITEAELKPFHHFGQHLGIAFQIADDILDIVGKETETGKTMGTDLSERKPTLPLIYYFQEASPCEKEKMIMLLNHNSPIEARGILMNSDVISKAKAAIAHEIKQAKESLFSFSGDAVDCLFEICESMTA